MQSSRSKLFLWAVSFAVVSAATVGCVDAQTAPSSTVTPQAVAPRPIVAGRNLLPSASPTDSVTISVQGHAAVDRPADFVVASVAVQSQGVSPEVAIGNAASIASELQKALGRVHGVRGTITYANANVNCCYGGAQQPATFVAQMTDEITIDDLTQLSDVKGLIAATLTQVRYDVRDRAALDAQAMTAAIADARSQVEAITSKSNVRIGALRSLQTSINGFGQNLDRTAVRVDATASAQYDVSTP